MTPRQEDGHSKAGGPGAAACLGSASLLPSPGAQRDLRSRVLRVLRDGGCSGAPGGREARDSAAIPGPWSPADQGDGGSEDELRRESGGPRSGDGPGIPVSVGAVHRVLCDGAPCPGRGSWEAGLEKAVIQPSAAADAVTALYLVSKAVIKRITRGAAVFNPTEGTGSRK